MKKVLVSIMMMVLPLVASAYDAQIGGIYYNLVKKAKVAEVTYRSQGISSPFSDYSGDIVIPATIEYEGITYDVKNISDFAFNDCEITSISFPNCIQSIGSMSFYGCKKLKAVFISDLAAWCRVSIGTYGPLTYAHHLYLDSEEITELVIPEGVTGIGSHAFAGCNSFVKIKLPESLEEIGNGAFQDCSNVSSISIPNNVLSIGNETFSNCSSLVEIHVGEGVKSIGKDTFSGCSSLTTIELPNVTVIEDKLFKGCSSLKTILLGNGVTSIGNSAFSGCQNLETVNLGAGLLTIGDNSFSGCSSLSTIVIPDNVKSIGFGTFYNCTGMVSVKIGDGVTSIGKQAFDSCSSLEAIFMGKSIATIGDFAFTGCNKLQRVHISDIEAWCSINTLNNKNNPLIYAHHLYLNNDEIFNLTIPQNIAEINQYTFAGCSFLSTVTIHDKVKKIGSGAFAGCEGLSAVYIKDLSAWCKTIFGIGSNPLYHARHLYLNDNEITNLIIPDDVEYINERAFYGCDGISSLHLNKVKSLGSGCFSECGGLNEIVIGDSVQTVYSEAFYGCSNLATVKIPNTETIINSQAFGMCENLLDVFCFGEKMPKVANDIFKDSDIKYSNLHVPQDLLDTYKTTYPWSEFGNIIALTENELSVANTHSEIDTSRKIYLLNGCESSHLQKGLNIIYVKKGKNYKIIK